MVVAMRLLRREQHLPPVRLGDQARAADVKALRVRLELAIGCTGHTAVEGTMGAKVLAR